MGYRRNDLARAMVTGKNFVLGFLTREPSSEGSARMMVGAQEEANLNGYLIKLLPVPTLDDYRVSIQRVTEQRLAGMLVQNLGTEILDYLHAEAERANIPVALMDDSPPQKWGFRVTSDDERGLHLALEHLRELGHRRIGFVAAQANSALSNARTAIFRAWMTQHGEPSPENFVIYTDWQKAEVIEPRVQEFLARPGRPTALLCAGDMIAMSTFRAARAAGYQLPQDVSVIGCADFLMASFADPPLTTIAQPFEEIGRSAVRRLLAGEKEARTGDTLRVPTSLVIRSSTTAPAPI
jgi:DNA-binding LacI/PurR family transcriptional regulator